jgi:hypothetical protein
MERMEQEIAMAYFKVMQSPATKTFRSEQPVKIQTQYWYL